MDIKTISKEYMGFDTEYIKRGDVFYVDMEEAVNFVDPITSKKHVGNIVILSCTPTSVEYRNVLDIDNSYFIHLSYTDIVQNIVKINEFRKLI